MVATQWPVGQAVKTAASHAANMGSIPVRVTTQKQASDHLFQIETAELDFDLRDGALYIISYWF